MGKYRMQQRSWKAEPCAVRNIYEVPPDSEYITGHVVTPLGIVLVTGTHCTKATKGHVWLRTVVGGRVYSNRIDPCPAGPHSYSSIARLAHKWIKGLSPCDQADGKEPQKGGV